MCCKSTLKRRQLATGSMIIEDGCLWPKDISSNKLKILILGEKSRRGQTCNGSFAQRESERKKAKNMPNNSGRGDCILWNTKGQCSFGDSCAFKHDPKKKGKGKERPRSPSPTGPPHRNSIGDGKGSDDGFVTDTPKFTGKSPWGKANRPLCTNFKKGSCQKGNSCNYCHVPECTTFETPGGCKLSDKCVFKHTAKSSDEKKNQQLLPSTSQQSMNVRCNYERFSRMTRPNSEWDLHHLGNKYVLKRENLGFAVGVIQTGSQNPRNPNVPTFDERSIEWTLSMKEIARKAAWIFHKKVYRVSGSYNEDRNKFFKPSSTSNVSSPSKTTSKKRDFIVHSGASLHMMSKTDVALGEQEMIQKSNRSIGYYDCEWDCLYDRRSNSKCPWFWHDF